MKHLTVRLAWHDNEWNGRICDSPQRNVYCVGSYSLLSDRLQRERKVDLEEKKAGQALDVLYPDYVPPCFWSSNAFSLTPSKVVHVHPFHKPKGSKRIPDSVVPYSVFTWPFRLSFVHADENKKRDGQYPADLPERITRYREMFTSGASLVFFYLNYDNPVSADDYRYALVGCARLTEIGETQEYPFSPAEVVKMREGENMQNMPTMNWALPVTYDGAKSVKLPYHEYLAHIEQQPDDEPKLREMRVLVEEDELVRCFKYVSEPVDDDRALYLLYKLRKAITVAEGHGIAKALGNSLETIDEFIKDVWAKRGIYPSVSSVVALMAEVSTGAGPDEETAEEAMRLCETLRKAGGKESNLSRVFSLIGSSKPIPAELSEHAKLIKAARRGFKDNTASEPLLRRLCQFNLSAFQLRRIVFRDSLEKEPAVFGASDIDEDDLVHNPYLLCERYVPVTDNEKWRKRELDVLDRRDGPINPFIIDIGLFPDTDYIDHDEDLGDLTPSSPERLRALITEHLHLVASEGDCYSSSERVLEYLRGEPLFYRRLQENKLTITRKQLTAPAHCQHYQQRLHLREQDNEVFFYLREVKQAEELVARLILELSKRKDHKVNTSWIDLHLDEEVKELKKRPKFDEKQFRKERRDLLEGALKRSIYVISGKAGSGKTHALRKVVEKIESAGENVTVLAPTGKAALRARQEAKFEDAQTIDRFLFKSRLGVCLQDLEAILNPPRATAEPVQNIIVDESSMLDLQKLATLVQLVEQQGRNGLQRLIFIGDENQLPPIGLGRPFHDLVSYLQEDPGRRERHMVRLVTDCRQQSDSLVTEVAEIFVGKNRYFAPMLAKIQKPFDSEHLKVFYWDTPEELTTKIDQQLANLLRAKGKLNEGVSKPYALNLLFGLYDTGNVPNFDAKALTADAFQIITPYRSGGYGTLGLNRAVRDIYKEGWWPEPYKTKTVFGHSDRIIRNKNWYRGFGENREMVLSNGSIGFVCNSTKGRKYFFPDSEKPIWAIDDEENFELAYAITVHRAQGSEFDHVFVVIPEKRALLNRELVYTALTRSSGPVTLFVQKTERENPLEFARNRSAVLLRNTSLFAGPLDAQRQFQPEPGVWVKSKIEYIIHSILKEHREKGALEFGYEQPLLLTSLGISIKPDFRIVVGGKTYYWEHLGMLDTGRYFSDWQERRKGYYDSGFGAQLVTSDDLLGVDESRLRSVVEDILNGAPKGAQDARFSDHHYQLRS
jgi:ATP-dependent exoDNAse (exonuclease V) alpha subunit